MHSPGTVGVDTSAILWYISMDYCVLRWCRGSHSTGMRIGCELPIHKHTTLEYGCVKIDKQMRDKTVLITGGSSGIGAAFARHLAGEGARLVLVARNQARLAALKSELGTAAEILPCDLSVPGAAATIHAAVGEIDLLINNAGYASFGAFGDSDLATQRGMIQVHIAALVELTHAYLPVLQARRGGIIHVASISAFAPAPMMAVYAASKAFILSFSEALAAEYQDRGVTVLALCPGPTESELFSRVGTPIPGTEIKASAESVVLDAMRAYRARRSHVIPGWRNYLGVQGPRFLPRALVLRLMKQLNMPK